VASVVTERRETMPRYIDADKLKERLMVGSELDPEPCKGFRSALLAMVDTQEDADAVPVVRCADCKYLNEELASGGWDGSCRYWNNHAVTYSWFCSQGERSNE
jgi:hypothetical protein